jgi:hypothetical protein
MGSHRRWDELVDAVVSDAATADEQARLRKHVTACLACAARLREHRALRNALQTSLPVARPGRSFALTPEMLRADEPEQEPVSRLARMSRGASMTLQGAAAALLIASGTLLAVDQPWNSDGNDHDTAVPASAEITTMSTEESADAGSAGAAGAAPAPETDSGEAGASTEDGNRSGYAPQHVDEGDDASGGAATVYDAPAADGRIADNDGDDTDWLQLATIATGVAGLSLAGVAGVAAIERRRAGRGDERR